MLLHCLFSLHVAKHTIKILYILIKHFVLIKLHCIFQTDLKHIHMEIGVSIYIWLIKFDTAIIIWNTFYKYESKSLRKKLFFISNIFFISSPTSKIFFFKSMQSFLIMYCDIITFAHSILFERLLRRFAVQRR